MTTEKEWRDSHVKELDAFKEYMAAADEAQKKWKQYLALSNKADKLFESYWQLSTESDEKFKQWRSECSL